MSRIAIAIAKTTVRRSLIGMRPAGLVPQPIADAADRFNGRSRERPVDLVAQVADVDVDDVRIALEREVPDVLEQLPARERLSRMLHQVLEERELLRCQIDATVAASDRVLGRIEGQVTDLEDGRSLMRPSPDE